MDALMSFKGLVEIAGKFGLVGLILLLWWYDNRQIRQQNEQHKSDLKLVLDGYQADMKEQREMYKNNASLCKDFANIATDLREIVILNTQTMTTVSNEIRQNEFCPMQRVKKEQIIRDSGY